MCVCVCGGGYREREKERKKERKKERNHRFCHLISYLFSVSLLFKLFTEFKGIIHLPTYIKKNIFQ